MLLILTKDSKAKTLEVLGSVLKTFSSLEVRVTNDPAEVTSLCLTKAAKTVLALGAESLQLFQNAGVAPKNRKTTGLRKQVFKWHDVPVLFSYSTGIKNIEYRYHVDLLTDTSLAARLAATGSTKPVYGLYEYVPTLTPVVQGVRSLLQQQDFVDLAFDTETLGLDRFHKNAFLVSLQFSYAPGHAQLIAWPTKTRSLEDLLSVDMQKDLSWLLNEQRIRLCAANGKYDLEWVYEQTGVECTNFTFDTTAVGSLLDENRSNALDVHAKIYVPSLANYSDEFDQKADKSRMDLEYQKDPEEFKLYAGGDPDATLQVKHEQKIELLKDHRLTTFYVKVLHPALRAFEQVERVGVLVDMEAYAELADDLLKDMQQSVAQAKKLIGGLLVAKHTNPKMPFGLNLQKASLIIDYMFSPSGLNLKPKMWTDGGQSGEKKPSTAMEHLEMFKDHPEAKEFVAVLMTFGQAKKVYDTYVVGFQQHLRPDGRYHPTYWLFAGDKDEDEGGTNCMPSGELVLTDRGYLPVEKVSIGDRVISHTGTPRRVINTVINGVKPIVKVTLSNGLVLRTTPNHAYRIGDGWVEAGKLQPGMQAWAHSGVEDWAPIEGWEDYLVSSWGRIKNIKTGNLVTQYPKGKWGHLKVTLRRNGCQKRGPDLMDFSVHRIVAEAFVGKSGGAEVRHRNGIAWDNTVSNLEWGTPLQNRQDAVVHGSMNRRYGGQAKLSDQAVSFIRAQPVATRTTGITNQQLADRFGVCSRLIRDIRAGRRWQDLPDRRKVVSFSPVTVVSVEEQLPVMTYGLTVEEDHSHVTGGVVTHNTGRLSARDPAFQCLSGDTLVLTNWGYLPIRSIVEAHEKGGRYYVLTHTGKWKPVVGVYRNGVQPVFSVQSESGRLVTSTANHPYLTQRGWVRTDQLVPGDTLYELRSPNPEVHESDLPQLGGDEEQVYQSDKQRLAPLRWSGYNLVSGMARVQELPEGHGREASERVVHRTTGQQRPVLQEQLQMGFPESASKKSLEHQATDLERSDQDRSGVGDLSRHQQREVALPIVGWDADGSGTDEYSPWDRSVFQETQVLSITPAGECETFDLTIEGSHSFVANGLVVHNTIPKHGKWGKRIRRVFIAPPGYLIVETDYSQGELRVVACIANELNMLQAYKDGLDLHVVTSGTVAGYTYAEMMELSKSNPELYESIRQLGKAGNFGLVYGMGVDGFIVYARNNYGVELPWTKADEFRTGFFNTYPALIDYHKQYKALARKHGQVVSPLGRIRHLPLVNSDRQDVRAKAERQAINSPVQGCLSDMMIWAIAEQQRMGWQKQSPCFGSIHDAGYYYVPEDNAEFYAKRIVEVMENLPFHEVGWAPQLKFPADAKIGPNMADLKKLKF